MKLNKTIGRVATTLVATAMLASLAAPAYAANMDSTGVVAGDGDVVTINQKIDMTGSTDASVPSVTFTYTVAANETVEGADASVPAYAGITNGVTATAAVFGDGDDVKGSDNTVTETFNVDFTNVTWTGVGVYRYKLTYSKDNAAVTVPSDDARYLDVYVGNDDADGYKVLYYVLTSDGGALKYNTNTGAYNYDSKTDGFTADYDTYTLTVKKYITGDMANLGDTFNFGINFTNLPDGVQLNKDGQDIDGTNDSFITDTLGNGGTIVISGIPAVAKDGTAISYTVSEQFATSKGYNTKYEVNTDVKAWQGDNAKEILGVDQNGTTTMMSEAQNMSTSGNVIEFNNNKESVTPTGIVMNVAPYALLVVIAAAGCFVFLRKRRED